MIELRHKQTSEAIKAALTTPGAALIVRLLTPVLEVEKSPESDRRGLRRRPLAL